MLKKHVSVESIGELFRLYHFGHYAGSTFILSGLLTNDAIIPKNK